MLWLIHYKQLHESIRIACQTWHEGNHVVSDHLLESNLFTNDLPQADQPQVEILRGNRLQVDLLQIS